MITQYRVRESDTNSIVEPAAAALFQLAAPESAVLWDLLPFYDDIKTHKYDMASRTRTALKVTLNAVAIATNATSLQLASGADRVGNSYVLYDPTTRQTITLNSNDLGSGVFNIRSVTPQFGQSRAIIAANSVLTVLSISEDYHRIQNTVTFEETTKESNFIQDLTKIIPFFRADLEEVRKWGISDRMILSELMDRTLRELNNSVLYGTPVENGISGSTGQTAGIDYVIRKAGNVFQKAGATDELSDLEALFVDLRKKGISAADRARIVCGVDTYEYWRKKGIATVTQMLQPGSTTPTGVVTTGLNVAGFGFVPFVVDATIEDKHTRILTLNNAYKAYYKGDGPAGEKAVMRLIDEPGLSTSKNKVSTLQMKWGTVIDGDKHRFFTGSF